MNWKLWADVILAFGISLFTAQNDQRTAATLRKLQATKDSNTRFEEHMQRVADGLIAGEPLDWDELDAEIDAEVDEFLSRGEDGQAPPT